MNFGKQIIECVPNFSEGRDAFKIKQITNSIEKVDGVKLLHVDTGYDTNRTVVTFAGYPSAVCEAAYNAVKMASEIIDMSCHTGKHPRIGATDVCPLVPISNITMDETIEYAKTLAEKIGTELEIPVYCYENLALSAERRNLAYCRKGEYEGLKAKLAEQKPDFGSIEYSSKTAKTGATIVGVRDFLVAVNFNLNTTSKEIASKIALWIRERGTGIQMKGIKAIGWFISDFGIAQVSVNITDVHSTPLFRVYEEISKKAMEYNVVVTGTEIIGLVSLKVILDCGKHFMLDENDEDTLINSAILNMNLCEFVPHEKILEKTLYVSESYDK